MAHPSIARTVKSRITSPPALLLLVVTLSIMFLTLYPWVGWRGIAIEPWAFISDPWPRYWTAFDLTANVFAYVPLGFLFVLLVARPVDRCYTLKEVLLLLIAATLFGSGLSFILECLQSWLPNRFPSKLDWTANSVGTLIGAACGLGLTYKLQRRLQASLYSAQAQSKRAWSRLPPGRLSLGLLTLVIWVAINSNPQRLLFATGEISALFDVDVTTFALVDSGILEAFIVIAQMCIVSCIVWTATSNQLVKRLLLVFALGGGLMMKSVSSSWLVSDADAFWWLTPGAQAGMLIGAICVALIITLKPQTQIRIAQIFIVSVTILVNFAPENPFYDSMIERWDQGRWSSLHALVVSFAYLWPVMVFIYLWLARLAYNRR
jgi:VanZ family protein